MKKLLYAFLSTVSSVVISCSVTGKKLDLAASIVDDYPDSALTVLQSIPDSDLKTKRLRAEFSLLNVLASDKCYIIVDDLCGISEAAAYFHSYGSIENEIKSLYCLAVVHFNRGEYEKSMVALTAAEEMITESMDARYAGLVYSAISDVYNVTHNSEQELQYIRKAEKVFNESKDYKYYFSTLSRKSQALMNIQDYDAAEEIMRELINNDTIPAHLKNIAKEDYGLLLLTRNPQDFESARCLFEEVISECGQLRDINLWAAYAYSLCSCGYKEESMSMFEQLYSMELKDYSIVDIWKTLALELSENYHDAYFMLKKSLTYQDSLLNIKLANSAVQAKDVFLLQRNINLKNERKTRSIVFAVIILCFTVLLLLSYTFYKYRNEKLKNEKQQIEIMAQTVRHQMAELEKRVSEEDEVLTKREQLKNLRTEYIKTYKTHFQYIGTLCEEFIKKDDKDKAVEDVAKKIKIISEKINGDDVRQKQFELMIDRNLGGAISHFREDFPGMKEADYRFISCIFVGFDATTLSIIFNMPSIDSVYMRKSRLKKKVESSTVKYRSDYLELF